MGIQKSQDWDLLGYVLEFIVMIIVLLLLLFTLITFFYNPKFANRASNVESRGGMVGNSKQKFP